MSSFHVFFPKYRPKNSSLFGSCRMHVKKGSFVKKKSGASEIDMSNDKGTPLGCSWVYPIGSVNGIFTYTCRYRTVHLCQVQVNTPYMDPLGFGG